MITGADSIDDLDVLRHGRMTILFGEIRAPSTFGSFLRGFDWGNMRQLEVVSRRLLVGLAAQTPVLADAGVLAHLDIDSTQRRVYGHVGPLLGAVRPPLNVPVRTRGARGVPGAGRCEPAGPRAGRTAG